MRPAERSMVLSDWKKSLWDERPGWGRALHSDEWWALVNYVIDRISLPSAAVWMACHVDEPDVPLCWAAVRDWVFLYLHARPSVRMEPELAAFIELSLRSHVHGESKPFNPFHELKRLEKT